MTSTTTIIKKHDAAQRSIRSTVAIEGTDIELEVGTSHNKDRKCLVTYATRKVRRDNVVTYAVMEDVQRLRTSPIARYSAKVLESQHAELEDILNDPDWLSWAREASQAN